MERTGLQRTWVRITLTILTFAVMALIFWFSTETADDSDETSGQISREVINVLYPEYATYTVEWQQRLYNEVQYAVRKAAHFSEYALLGIVLRLCLESWFGKQRWLNPATWLGGVFYACTDELHQLMTEGRNGQWTDVLIDSSGVLAGLLISASVLLWIGRRRTKAEADQRCP